MQKLDRQDTQLGVLKDSISQECVRDTNLFMETEIPHPDIFRFGEECKENGGWSFVSVMESHYKSRRGEAKKNINFLKEEWQSISI